MYLDFSGSILSVTGIEYHCISKTRNNKDFLEGFLAYLPVNLGGLQTHDLTSSKGYSWG